MQSVCLYLVVWEDVLYKDSSSPWWSIIMAACTNLWLVGSCACMIWNYLPHAFTSVWNLLLQADRARIAVYDTEEKKTTVLTENTDISFDELTWSITEKNVIYATAPFNVRAPRATNMCLCYFRIAAFSRYKNRSLSGVFRIFAACSICAPRVGGSVGSALLS